MVFFPCLHRGAVTRVHHIIYNTAASQHLGIYVYFGAKLQTFSSTTTFFIEIFCASTNFNIHAIRRVLTAKTGRT